MEYRMWARRCNHAGPLGSRTMTPFLPSPSMAPITFSSLLSRARRAARPGSNRIKTVRRRHRKRRDLKVLSSTVETPGLCERFPGRLGVRDEADLLQPAGGLSGPEDVRADDLCSPHRSYQ